MRILTPLFLLAASPAFAAGDKPFFSLKNTDFVVLIAFIAFFAVLAYFKVPQLLMGLLDKRAEGTMRLIYALRKNGVSSKRVLDAIEKTPREFFLDRAHHEYEPVLEQPRVDVVGAFAAGRLFHDHRHQVQ